LNDWPVPQKNVTANCAAHEEMTFASNASGKLLKFILGVNVVDRATSLQTTSDMIAID